MTLLLCPTTFSGQVCRTEKNKSRTVQGENNTRFIGCQELKGAIAFHPAFNELKCQIVLIGVESKILDQYLISGKRIVDTNLSLQQDTTEIK